MTSHCGADASFSGAHVKRCFDIKQQTNKRAVVKTTEMGFTQATRKVVVKLKLTFNLWKSQ